jgi:hypothetical protein
MPAWIIPALKAILPHIGTIVAVAAPAFTKKPTATSPDPMRTLQQQITELQAAASTSDAQIKALAEQLRTAITTLEAGAETIEQRQRSQMRIAVAAVGIGVCAVGIALFALLPG